MDPFFTFIFLACSFLVLLPVVLLGWDMFKARKGNGSSEDVKTLARMILYITGANLLFHASQFATVLLGALGVGMQARIPIIIMIDGSLVLLAIVYIYAYFQVRAIRKRQM